ncbi:putative DNA binding domain-containing protein [Streptomyces sp. NBC_00344]
MQRGRADRGVSRCRRGRGGCADVQGCDRARGEGVDLDWKRDFYRGTDAGRKELAKDVCAMANTVGGLVVVGVDDGKQDQLFIASSSSNSSKSDSGPAD